MAPAERRPAVVDGDPREPLASSETRESSESVEWVRTNAVILTAVALVAAQLWWKAHMLAHFYFRQDDFQLMDHALASRLSLTYLFTINSGHLMPGGLASTWVLVRLSMYDWTLASTVTVLLLAAAGLAVLRLLLLLFGRRPAILIPLAIYLFTPLTLPGLSFWSTTIMWLPLQLTTALALGSQVRYLRSGQFRHAIAAAGFVAAGMLFDEQGALVPLLAFGLTSAYFAPGGWLGAARTALRRYWRAWLLYGTLTAGYVALFAVRLQTSAEQPGKPGMFSGVLTLASTMVRTSFIPAAFGGPWHWYAPGGDYGYAVQTPVLTELSWVLAVLVVGASLWYRRHALRAWVLLALWLLLADLAPLVVGRVSDISATILGLDLHYLADAAPVLAVCVGLAFWPIVDEQRPYRCATPHRAPRFAVTVALVGCFLAGSAWSGATYLKDTSSAATRSYVATAKVALARAQPGTVIASGATPQHVMYAGYLGSAAQTSRMLAPLIPPAARIRITAAPAGAISNLMIFDGLGRLLPAVDVGAQSAAPPRPGCWPVTATAATAIPLRASIFDYSWIVQLRYAGPGSTLQLRLGAGVRTVLVPAGEDEVYVPVTGRGGAVLLRALRMSPGGSGCVSSLTVGLLQASRSAIPLPFSPVPG